MGRSRGYSNYRGRRSKGKAALAVLLVLVILAALAVLLLQRHIVYDETGTPRLEVPWGRETAEDAAQAERVPELDLVVQPPKTPEVHGILLPAGPLTRQVWETALAEDPQCDAVAVVLKDGAGTVYAELPSAVAGSTALAEDTASVLTELTAGELRTIAALNCLRDPGAASADPAGMGLMTADGAPFRDGGNSLWLDPAKPAARQYVCALAVEAAELGFDELLLTDVGYPTDGPLDQLAADDAARREALGQLLEELRAALEPYGTLVTLQVPADLLTAGAQEPEGQLLAVLTALADRLCAEVTPTEAAALSGSLERPFLALLPEKDPAWTGSYLVLH